MILKKAAGTIIFIGALTICAASASATKTVTSPYVHEGEAAVEWKGGYDFKDDEDEWEMETSASYGLTEFWETEIGFEFAQEANEDFETKAIVFENKFQLAPKGFLPIDPGLKIEYAKSLTGGPDELQAKLLLARQFGKIANTANFSVSDERGDDAADDEEYGFAHALTYEHSDDFACGLEWYSDFGTFEEDSDDWDEQSHQVGPVVYGVFAENVGYEAGVLIGASENAPDAALKAVLEYEF